MSVPKKTDLMASAPAKHAREICLSFPESVETKGHGHPVFRVGREAFAALEIHSGELHLAVRVGPEDYKERSTESRLLLERHVAKEGWVLLKLARVHHWDEVRDLVLLSYVAVAPKKMLQALERTLTLH